MKAKSLNGNEVDVIKLNPVAAFGVIIGELDSVIVETGEFPRKGKAYIYKKVSGTPDQYKTEYDEFAREFPDIIIPTLEEMLTNDGAVIGLADYELVDGDDDNFYMRFTDIRQFDTQFKIDANGVLNINTEIGPYSADIVNRPYRFIVPKLGESDEWNFKCLEPPKHAEADAPIWAGLKCSDAHALGYVKAEELLLKNTFGLWGDAELCEEAEERLEKNDAIPQFIKDAPADSTKKEKVVALAAFLAACEERIKTDDWREKVDEVAPIVDRVFSFYFLLPALRDCLKIKGYEAEVKLVSKD